MPDRLGATVTHHDGPDARVRPRLADPVADARDDGLAVLEEPPRRTVTRRQRRRRRRRVRRLALVVLMLALVAGVAAALVLVLRSDDDAGGGDTLAPPPPPVDTGAGAVLVATFDLEGRVQHLLLVGEDEGGDPSVLLVPTRTQVEVPSLGLQALGDVAAMGGEQLLPIAVSNALGVRIGSSPALLSSAGLGEVIGALPSVDVRLRTPVDIRVGDEVVDLPAGPHRVSGREAWILMSVPGGSSELDDLVTVQAVLEGLLAAAADPAVAEALGARGPELEPLLALAGADVGIRTLPVEPMASGTEERYRIREEDLDATLAGTLAGTRLDVDGSRPRTEIRNGTGDLGVSVAVAERIVPLGAEVVLTGNVPGFGVSETTVAYHRDENRDVARMLAEALGGVPVGRADPVLGSVDVTIVVGADLVASPDTAD